MSWRLIFAADWRNSDKAEEDQLIKFVNDSDTTYFIAGGDYCGSPGKCKGYTPAEFKAKILKTNYFFAGNHEGGACEPTCVPNKTYIANFNNKGVQVALIGCGAGDDECNSAPDTFDWTQIKDTSPALVFMHHNFIGYCGTHTLKHKDKLDALPTCITAGCGHEHTYAEQFGSPGTGKTDRVYMQSGTPDGLKRCGPAGWLVGYWLFDDSVSGKLTVKYKSLSVHNFYSNVALATANRTGGTISSVTIDRGGSGYTNAPSVRFVGGGGSGATATATINTGTGKVAAINMTNVGSGYTSAPHVAIWSSPIESSWDHKFTIDLTATCVSNPTYDFELI